MADETLNLPEKGPLFVSGKIPCPDSLKSFVGGDEILIELGAQRMFSDDNINTVGSVIIALRDKQNRDVRFIARVSGPGYEVEDNRPSVLVSNMGGTLRVGQLFGSVGEQDYTSEQAMQAMPALYGAVADWMVSSAEGFAKNNPKNSEYYKRAAQVWGNVVKK